MQPCAVDIELIRFLLDYRTNIEHSSFIYQLSKKLAKFHSVVLDKGNQESAWLLQLSELIQNIEDQNQKKQIEDLFLRNEIKFELIELKEIKDLFIDLSASTPDKIGLGLQSLSQSSLKIYDISTFTGNEFSSDCRLYRIPKQLKLNANYEFNLSSLLGPFLREAEMLEFCDKFLFKNEKYTPEDFERVERLLSLSPKCESLIIYSLEPKINAFINSRIKKLEEKVNKAHLSIKLKLYDKKRNHDRFIIVDNNNFSIRFTQSFNNLQLLEQDRVKAKTGFGISVEKGRSYLEEEIK